MTQQQILESNWTKTKKAEALFDLGFTRLQVAELICNGNRGFSYNIWKKWNERRTAAPAMPLPINFDFAFTRKFGVEIEFFGPTQNQLSQSFRANNTEVLLESYNHQTRPHWKVVTDGSLVGENSRELVSPILQGTEGLKELRKACKSLRQANAKVNRTCGVHIHLDANDYSIENFKTLLKNQYFVEQQIDKIMPTSRRANSNRYCQGFRSEYQTSFFQKIDACQTIHQMTNLFRTRYFKLNIQSFQRHGTVEFRQHGGSTNYLKIKNWIFICARLVEFSKQNIIITDINQILDENLQEYIEDRELALA
ncbi:amidoligase family protein [Elizabethkingia meningoseptica]|uniref:amidoligase family protein n=1 Tax=Elizabethkingia meningoseptica TaxID=238 RepID=UPI0018C2AD14|nr:amidoligase family protein [Elizabethkingia meningoseptica]MBG0515317.1 amidoligase family protein [Elizabethkingia meningoseptica]